MPPRPRPRSKADPAAERRSLTLEQAFRKSNDVMFYCDKEGRILDVNDAFTRVYGWSREEAAGRRPAILRSAHSTDSFYRRMWSEILDPARGYWRGEIINRSKDGSELPMLLTISSVRGEDGTVVGYMSNASDLSGQKALEARVAQSEALAALGEMATIVAHEIRNPLGSVVMAAKQLAEGGLDPADRETVTRVLHEEGRRLNQTLSNLLAYARPPEARLAPVDLNAMVSDVAKTLEANRELLGECRVELRLDKALGPFPADPDQLRQVVWNLALNAVQAMEGKGRLTVETRRERGAAVLRVADTGPGIGPERRALVFKPFHTTKRQGTGLGLAIAERVATAHGGRIELQSEPGKGASFTVTLPVEGA